MVNIDTVYQTVLAIANKEQRGYITPQEFNLFANQAQMEIFEQYFYDENQFSRIPGNSTEHSDMLDLLEEKISIFKVKSGIPINPLTQEGFFPSNIYRLGNLYGQFGKIEEVDENYLFNISNSIVLLNQKNQVFTKYGNTFIVHPQDSSLSSVTATYVRKPINVNWGYNVIDENAIYDTNSSVNFEIHASEQTSLVMKILSYAGITLKDNTLYQVGEASEVKKIQQEKQ